MNLKNKSDRLNLINWLVISNPGINMIKSDFILQIVLMANKHPKFYFLDARTQCLRVNYIKRKL